MGAGSLISKAKKGVSSAVKNRRSYALENKRTTNPHKLTGDQKSSLKSQKIAAKRDTDLAKERRKGKAAQAKTISRSTAAGATGVSANVANATSNSALNGGIGEGYDQDETNPGQKHPSGKDWRHEY